MRFIKHLFLVFLAVMAFNIFAPAVYAGSAIQENFNVNEYLKGTGQGQGYFDEAKKLSEQTGQPVSPVAAFIVDVINFLTMLIGTVSLLVFIVGALLTIASEGQEDRLQKGKQAMLYAIIGLVIALASYLIAAFTQSVFF